MLIILPWHVVHCYPGSLLRPASSATITYDTSSFMNKKRSLNLFVIEPDVSA